MKVRDVKKRLFAFFRPLIKAPEINIKGQRKLSEDQRLEEEYKFFFENPLYTNN